MDGCVEPHHPLMRAQTLQTVDKTGGRRRQWSFSHMRRMMSSGYANRKTHAAPREVSVVSAVAEREGWWKVARACKPVDSRLFPLCRAQGSISDKHMPAKLWVAQLLDAHITSAFISLRVLIGDTLFSLPPFLKSELNSKVIDSK